MENDEDYDDLDLLQNLPSAYDAIAPSDIKGGGGASTSSMTGIRSHASGVFEASPFQETFLQDDNAYFMNPQHDGEVSSKENREEVTYVNVDEGEEVEEIEKVPVANEENSVLVKGDNGVCRWVRLSGRKRKRVDRENGEDRCYYDSESEEEQSNEKESLSLFRSVSATQPGLLNRSFHDVVLEATEKLKERALEKEYSEMEGDAPSSSAPPTPTALFPNKSTLGELWVSKYSPKSFREALSDESINLAVLQWLRSWDSFVFASEDATTTTTGSGNKVDTPPDERICTLVGPPGVGKTTLAHIIALHCGYEPVEVNASFERSASRLESLIETVVSAPGKARRVKPNASKEGVHLLDQLLRPRCLIIDEIDGISANVAQFLSRIKSTIQRPVFCLCNDYYVPSLRALRASNPLVFHFPPIHHQRLLLRLEEVCRREGVQIPQTVLADLVQLTHGDIRSCLNTLQFLQASLQREQESASASRKVQQADFLTRQLREMQGKDDRRGGFELWKMIFHRMERSRAIQKLKKEYGIDYEALLSASAASAQRARLVALRQQREQDRLSGRPTAPLTDGSPALRIEVPVGFKVDPGYVYLSQQLLRTGEVETDDLPDALFDNYADMSYSDYSFRLTSAAAQRLSEQDVLSSLAFSELPALIALSERCKVTTALELYCYCSSSRVERVRPPRERQQLHYAQAQSLDVINAFRNRDPHLTEVNRSKHIGCQPSLLAFLTDAETLSAELAPYLSRTLFDGPALRLPTHSPHNLRDLLPAQQQSVQQAVQRHVTYGLRYVEQKKESSSSSPSSHLPYPLVSEEVPSTWVLEPNVTQLGGIYSSFAVKDTAAGTASTTGQHWKKSYPSSSTHRTCPSNILYEPSEPLKALVAMEMEKHFIRREVAVVGETNRPRPVKPEKDVEEGAVRPEKSKQDSVDAGKRLEEDRAPVEVAPNVAVKRDFFGRIINDTAKKNKVGLKGSKSSFTEAGTSHTVESSKDEGGQQHAPVVRYVYHDGATNGVKVPARLDEFLY